MRIPKLTGLLIAASLAIGACSAGSTPSPAATAPPASVPPSAGGGGSASAVTMQNLAFNPAALTVKVGTKVTWTNQDGIAHTVTFDTGGATSDLLVTGATYEQTFSTAGTLAYHCKVHPTMTGTVMVTQ